jgi:hypothetical protein
MSTGVMRRLGRDEQEVTVGENGTHQPRDDTVAVGQMLTDREFSAASSSGEPIACFPTWRLVPFRQQLPCLARAGAFDGQTYQHTK